MPNEEKLAILRVRIWEFLFHWAKTAHGAAERRLKKLEERNAS